MRHITRRSAREWRHSLGVALLLGLGIGPAAIGLTAVNSILLHPLPYRDAGRIGVMRIDVGELRHHAGLDQNSILDLRATTGTFKAVEWVIFGTTTSTGGRDTVSVAIAGVSPGLFDLFGVAPILGRPFRATDFDLSEERPARVVMLSHHMWQADFGSDPTIVGRTITVGGRANEIIGVLPRGFVLRLGPGSNAPAVVDMWGPVQATYSSRRSGFSLGWNALVRLEDGVSYERANDVLVAFAEQQRAAYPLAYGNSVLRYSVSPLLDDLVSDARSPIVAALIGVLLLLVTATVNATALIVVQHRRRAPEYAIRAAIGAGRRTLLLDVAVEGLLFSSGGAIIGGAATAWGIDAVRVIIPRSIPRWETIAFDWRLLAVPMAFASAILVAVSVADVWRHLSRNAGSGLGAGAERTTAPRTVGHSVLVGCQIAVAVILIYGAAQLVRSATALARADLGFEPRNAVSFEVELDVEPFSFAAENARYMEIRDRLRAMAGVVAASAVSSPPLGGRGTVNTFSPDGTRADGVAGEQVANFYAVLPGYFAAAGIPLVAGRDITENEHVKGLPVAVIDETLARTAFPGRDPIGRTLGVNVPGGSRYPRLPDARIVGVVAHARVIDPTRALRPQIYLPYGLWRWAPLSFVVRTHGDPHSVMRPARDIVKTHGTGQPATRIRYLADSHASATSVLRAVTMLATAAALLAACLAAFGLYATVSHLTLQERRATAIRVVLGASAGSVLRAHVRRVVLIMACAVPIGMAVCAAGARVLESLVYGVALVDVGSLTAASVVGVVVGGVATYVPARRAATADPLVAIRDN